MNTTGLMADIGQRAVELTVNGDRLRWRAPETELRDGSVVRVEPVVMRISRHSDTSRFGRPETC